MNRTRLFALGAPLAVALAAPSTRGAPLPEEPAPPALSALLPHLVATVVQVSARRSGGGGSAGPLAPLLGGGEAVRSVGSGVVVDGDGLVLTSAHVVAGAERLGVTLADERERPARLVGLDAASDVALLSVDAERLPAATLGDSDAVRVGDPVIAIGSPFGLARTVTTGIVSARDRALGTEAEDEFLQTDAPLNPGSSGGPLFDRQGRVVGVTIAIVDRARGLGFAVPVNTVKRILPALRSHGRVDRGRVGVRLQHLTPLLSRALGRTRGGGALVDEVDEGGAAARAGLEPGDVVVAFDGEPVEAAERLQARLALLAPGTRARLAVERNGRRRDCTLRVDERPGETPSTGAGAGAGDHHPVAGRDAESRGGPPARPPGDPRFPLGVRVGSAPAPASRSAPTVAPGVIVLEVDPVGPAAGRLLPGDVLLELDRHPLLDVAAFERAARGALDAARPALLRLRRGPHPLFAAIPRTD